jgi:cellulose synthase/poly-beta-1,6-N-acetylglucosamine synthase-like glycosyltransferase
MTALRYSVVVPAYNAGATIQSCVEALVRQSLTREQFEVLVVDDGSTDATAGIAGGFPVTVVSQQNRGPAAARNHGARLARGGIVLFTDADCVPADDWIAQMVAPFADARVAAVKGAYKTSQRSLVARFAQVEFEERFEMLKTTDSIDMVDTYSAAFRKDVFERMRGFDESFPVANNEDTDLSYKLAAAGQRMVFNPGAVVFHLRHPDSLRRYIRQKFWRGYWRMVVYRRYPGKMVKDTYTPQTLKLQALALAVAVAALPAGAFFRPALGLAALSLLLFLAAIAPFALFAARRDAAVAALSPLLLAARAAAIGSGVLWFALSGRRRLSS